MAYLAKEIHHSDCFCRHSPKSGRVSPNTETARGTSWFSIYKAFHPIPSNEVCQALNASFNLRTSNCPSFLAARYGYDQIRISYRNKLSFPTHCGPSSAVTPLASPTVMISYSSKTCFKSVKCSSIPETF